MLSKMKFLLIGCALAAICLINSCYALDNLAQSFYNCARQFGGGDVAEEYRLSHMQLIDQPVDHCFAKCLWTDSNQYDASTNSINISKLIADLTSKGFAVPDHLLELGQPTDGSCKAVFEKTRTFILSEMTNSLE